MLCDEQAQQGVKVSFFGRKCAYVFNTAHGGHEPSMIDIHCIKMYSASKFEFLLVSNM